MDVVQASQLLDDIEGAVAGKRLTIFVALLSPTIVTYIFLQPSLLRRAPLAIVLF